ncbi:hypothetical protein OG21DRAFT_1491539 [Imleria badia]|nr:hypothetical protein OG21DRAFT_1491539 [Imleria badia]
MEDYGLKSPEQADVTMKAWNVEYAGKAAKGLLNHVKQFLPNAGQDDPHLLTTRDLHTSTMQQHNLNKPPPRRLYARYTAIIQSSGMGKSRTVDEMGKSELVIPMVLRPDDSTGEPSDSNFTKL